METDTSFLEAWKPKFCHQLKENGGYAGMFVDEACNLFPSSPSAALTESEHLKPAVLLPLRTGSVPKRSLLKSQPPPDASQSMIGAGTEKALNTKPISASTPFPKLRVC